MPITPFNPTTTTTPKGIQSWKPGQTLTPAINTPTTLQGKLQANPSYGSQVGAEQVAGAKKIAGSVQKGAADIQKGMQLGGLKGVPSVAKGFAESAFGTISGAAEAAFAPVTPAISKMVSWVTPALRAMNPQLAAIYDKAVPKVNALVQKHPESATLIGDMLNTVLLAVGGGIAEAPAKEAVGEAFTKDAFQGVKEDVTSAIKTGEEKVAKTPSKIGDIIVGKEAKYKAGKISQESTQQFIPKEQGGGGKMFGEVVDNTKNAIQKFRTQSMKTLNEVKSKITGSHFKQPDIAQVVNDKITSVLGRKAESRGIKGFDTTGASVDDLKSYGLINDNEEKLLKGMIKTLQDNPDITDRGILNMKEDLWKKYYKTGNQDYATSNKIVKSVYDGLNDLVGSANKNLKPALDVASENIKSGELMEKQLLGTGVEREAKLKSIAKGLKDGTINADDIALIQKLEKETGTKILPDLEGYGNYAELLSEKQKTGKFPTARGVKTKAIAKRLGIAGGITAAGAEIKHLSGF